MLYLNNSTVIRLNLQKNQETEKLNMQFTNSVKKSLLKMFLF